MLIDLLRKLLACHNFVVEEKELKKIKASFIIISGEKDIMTPNKSSKYLNNILPESKLEVIHDVGHFQPLESPLELNEIILRNIK